MNTSNETLVNEEIDLLELFYLFRQKLLWILAALVIGGLGVGAFTYFFITPTYEATAKLYIVSASNDSVVNLSDLQIGTSLTADYQELARLLGEKETAENVLLELMTQWEQAQEAAEE